MNLGPTVVHAYNARKERWLNLSRFQFLPLQVTEEWVFSDGAVRTCRHAEARCRVPIQQLQESNSLTYTTAIRPRPT